MAKYTVETIPAEKLLNYVKREDLTEALGAPRFTAIQNQAAAAGEKLTSKFIKDKTKQNNAFMVELRQSAWADNPLKSTWQTMHA